MPCIHLMHGLAVEGEHSCASTKPAIVSGAEITENAAPIRAIGDLVDLSIHRHGDLLREPPCVPGAGKEDDEDLHLRSSAGLRGSFVNGPDTVANMAPCSAVGQRGDDYICKALAARQQQLVVRALGRIAAWFSVDVERGSWKSSNGK
jgi:hypothetical protein